MVESCIIYGNSVLSAQLCCETKTALKVSIEIYTHVHRGDAAFWRQEAVGQEARSFGWSVQHVQNDGLVNLEII